MVSAGKAFGTGKRDLTHILTHNRKNPLGNNGAERANDLILLGQKRPERLINKWLEGSQAVGKDEVASSNLASSSKQNALKSLGFGCVFSCFCNFLSGIIQPGNHLSGTLPQFLQGKGAHPLPPSPQQSSRTAFPDNPCVRTN